MMPSTLLRNPNDRPTLTPNRETSCRTALTRGLKEYIASLWFIAPGGRELKFDKVLEVWAPSEVPQILPSAIIHSESVGRYDTSKFVPSIPGENRLPDGRYLVEQCEYVLDPINVEFWCSDSISRDMFNMMIEDAFCPTQWMYGFRLTLPHYFGAIAEYEPQSDIFQDNENDAMKKHRIATVSLVGRLTKMSVSGPLDGETRIGLQIDDGPIISVLGS